MQASTYKWIIHAALACVFLAILLPVIIYLLRTRRDRLSDVLAYFDQFAVEAYYKQFRPSQQPDSRSKSAFDDEVRSRFSWVYYVPPLLLLLALVLIFLLGADRTLEAWFKLIPPVSFSFSGSEERARRLVTLR